MYNFSIPLKNVRACLTNIRNLTHGLAALLCLCFELCVLLSSNQTFFTHKGFVYLYPLKVSQRAITHADFFPRIWLVSLKANLTGLEPVLFAVTGRCVNQLHHRSKYVSGRGGIRTHSPKGNGFTVRRSSPTLPPSQRDMRCHCHR